jgi:hypothetical protein
MHVNNYDLTPPKELLDQCVQVLIDDENIDGAPWKMKRWATEHCQSFVWMEEQDVSDVSVRWDYIYAFYFYEEKDALMFRLKYSH